MRYKYHLLAMVAIFFWGISLLSTRILLENGFTPNLITFFRFLLAGILIYIFQNNRKGKIKKADRKYFYLIALSSVTLFFFFENTGLKYTTVSNTALITSTIPLFTLLIAFLFFKKKLFWQNVVGIPLGLAGTFILFYKDLLVSGVHLKGDIFVFGSVTMWVVYSFVYKKIMHKYDTMFIVSRTFLYGICFLIPLILIEYRSFSQIQLSLSTIFHMLFLAVFCSYLGYYFWNIAIKYIGVKSISNFILFIPVVSISCGIIFLDEPFSINLIISTILITTGAYLTSVSDKTNNF